MLKPTTDPNASDARRDVAPARVDPRTGTTVLPLASNSRMVAGMPRGRAIAAPGEPGIISAEEDVLDINYEHSGP